MSVHYPTDQDFYDKLNAKLIQLEEEHAKIPRPHTEPAGAFYDALISVYEKIEKKCLAFLSKLAHGDVDDESDKIIDDVLKRLADDVKKTEIAFRGRATLWGQPTMGTPPHPLEDPFRHLEEKLYPIFIKYYLERHAYDIPPLEMSRQITELKSRDNQVLQGDDIQAIRQTRRSSYIDYTLTNARRLAERAAFVQIINKRYEEVARMNRELQQKYGGKYVAYVNENPKSPDYEYFYYEPGRQISTYDHPAITEQRIQREQDELKDHLNSLLVTAVEKSKTLGATSYYLMIDVRYSGVFVGGFGYRIILPFTRNTYPTNFSHIIRILTKTYGDSFVQPTFKNRKATRPIFIFNRQRFKDYETEYVFKSTDVIEMHYPLFEKWTAVSSPAGSVVATKSNGGGGKNKKKRTYKSVKLRKMHRKSRHRSRGYVKRTL
jgi:hypothetical protein